VLLTPFVVNSLAARIHLTTASVLVEMLLDGLKGGAGR
jgi:hypothetical protein